VIRIRVSDDLKRLRPAEALPSGFGQPVHFGGPLRNMDTKISMEIPRDIIYFDQCLPLSDLSALEPTRSRPIQPTSSFSRIAIRLDQFSNTGMIDMLRYAVHQRALSHLTLVCNNAGLQQHVENTPADGWGFRPIPVQVLRAHDFTAYELGRNAVERFRLSVPDVTHEFVFERNRLFAKALIHGLESLV
jgi:hypothetical protein